MFAYVCAALRVYVFHAVFEHAKATFTSVKTGLFMNAQGYSNEETRQQGKSLSRFTYLDEFTQAVC